jgi:hypothetical protein
VPDEDLVRLRGLREVLGVLRHLPSRGARRGHALGRARHQENRVQRRVRVGGGVEELMRRLGRASTDRRTISLPPTNAGAKLKAFDEVILCVLGEG